MNETDEKIVCLETKIRNLEQLLSGREQWIKSFLMPEFNKMKKKVTKLRDDTSDLRIDFARHKEGLDTYEELYSQLKDLQ